MAKDRVFIEDLRIETVIGVYDWEREIKQTIALDLEMAFDISKAAASDRIDDALDYKAVAKRLIQFVESSEFQLVEALAEHCAGIVLQEFPVAWLRLKLRKPGAVRGSSAAGGARPWLLPGASAGPPATGIDPYPARDEGRSAAHNGHRCDWGCRRHGSSRNSRSGKGP